MNKKTNIIKFKFSMFLVNKVFSGTKFFGIKRTILNSIGFEIGNEARVVGPLLIGRAAHIKVGENSWIGKDLTIHGNGKVEIGSRCDIAPEVTFLTGSHEIGDSSRRAGRGTSFDYSIGDGNWIGAKATFVNGASIGDSNIVGATSLVTKKFDENVILIGSPARVFKNL